MLTSDCIDPLAEYWIEASRGGVRGCERLRNNEEHMITCPMSTEEERWRTSEGTEEEHISARSMSTSLHCMFVNYSDKIELRKKKLQNTSSKRIVSFEKCYWTLLTPPSKSLGFISFGIRDCLLNCISFGSYVQ